MSGNNSSEKTFFATRKTQLTRTTGNHNHQQHQDYIGTLWSSAFCLRERPLNALLSEPASPSSSLRNSSLSETRKN